MKATSPPNYRTVPSRRAFLKGLGTFGAASLICSRPTVAAPAKYAHRFQLLAEGIVTDLGLVWPAPELPPLPPGTIIRIREEFPIDGKDILEFHTFVDFSDGSSAVVTLFHLRVDKINLSAVPAPNFGLFGEVIDNPVVNNPNHSPFGDLTGRVSIAYGEFDAPGDHTTFSLLGGAAAGSHASAVSTATGSLHIQGPWDSF